MTTQQLIVFGLVLFAFPVAIIVGTYSSHGHAFRSLIYKYPLDASTIRYAIKKHTPALLFLNAEAYATLIVRMKEIKEKK